MMAHPISTSVHNGRNRWSGVRACVCCGNRVGWPGGSVLRRLASGRLFFIGCCQLTISQGLPPLTPAKEYIRFNDKTTAIENAQVVATRNSISRASMR
jgi:hypothetical protein